MAVHARVTDASGVSRSAAGPWPVTTPVTSPRAAFEASFTLGLAPPVPTARFAVDAAATVFEGTFQQLELDASAGSLRDLPGGTAVACELGAPREVRAVRLATSVPLDPAASYSICVFRLDRDVPPAKPTVTAALGANRTAAVPTGFTDARFALTLQRAGAGSPEPLTSTNVAQVGLRSSPSAPRIALVPAGADPGPPFWQAAGELHTGDAGAAVHAGAALAAALQQLVDSTPGPAPTTVGIAIESDAPCLLVIKTFDVRYRFVSETFAVDALADGDVVDGAALVGALATATDPVSTFLRSALSAPLQAEVRLAGTTPGDALVASVRDELDNLVRSEELYDPARFSHVALRDETKPWLAAQGEPARAIRNRLLLADAYPAAIASPEDKRVLRFPAGSLVVREAFVRLPAGASVGPATLRTSERLHAERPADGGEAANGMPATKAGLQVGRDAQVAVRVVRPQAATTSALALALLPVEPQTVVDCELQEDWNGLPSGRVLAGGRSTLAAVGVPSWATVSFATPPVLDANPYWLAVHATQGSAVWLTEPAEDELRALRSDGAVGWDAIGPFDGARAVHRFYARVAPEDDRPGASVSVAGRPVDGATQDGFRTFDLAAALAAGLAGAASGPVSVPLAFEAVGGSITVYPPRIEYDLAERRAIERRP